MKYLTWDSKISKFQWYYFIQSFQTKLTNVKPLIIGVLGTEFPNASSFGIILVEVFFP